MLAWTQPPPPTATKPGCQTSLESGWDLGGEQVHELENCRFPPFPFQPQRSSFSTIKPKLLALISPGTENSHSQTSRNYPCHPGPPETLAHEGKFISLLAYFANRHLLLI